MTPKLRFPQFSEEWQSNQLSHYLSSSSSRNSDGRFTKQDVFSVSGEFGVVNQIDFQGRSFAGVSVLNYHVAETDDIIYTKSPLKSNPYGIIKYNPNKAGIVSTLYAVYRPKTTLYPKFIDYYFQLDDNVNKYLRPLVNKGSKNDMKINNERVMAGIVVFPSIAEQRKIAKFLTEVDNKIASLEKKTVNLQVYKLGIMKKIFSRKIHFTRDDGTTFSDWETKKLSDIAEYSQLRVDAATLNEKSYVGVDNLISDLGGKTVSQFVPATGKVTHFKVGDILHSNIRPYLRKTLLADTDGGASSDVLVIHPSNKVDTKYLYYQITTEKYFSYVMEGAKGIKMPRGDKGHIMEYGISVPDIEEQLKIADFLSAIDDKISLAISQAEKAKEFKKALLQKMFV